MIPQGKIKTKICARCKKEKLIKKFYSYKRGINKGLYSSSCKQCQAKYAQQYKETYPWIKHYFYIVHRCNYKKHKYHKRGIKNLLTI